MVSKGPDPRSLSYERDFVFLENIGSDHLKGGGEPHAWSSGSSTSFSSIISIFDGNLGSGNSSLTSVLVPE